MKTEWLKEITSLSKCKTKLFGMLFLLFLML